MIGRLALRDRLAVAFAFTLVAMYTLIAICSVIGVDRAVTASIDARLWTVAQAIVTIAGDESDEIDGKDREQFASIIADASGALVFNSQGVRLLGSTDRIPAWVRTALRDESSGRTFTTRADQHAIRAVVERYRSPRGNSTTVVWQSLQIVADLERTVVLVLAGFGVLVALGGYAIGREIARRGLLPLTRITAVIADIAARDLARRVGPQPHADELGRLAATFDRMLERLQAAFERQRQFTADASHDLRAPLATLRAEVELALRRDRTNGEYRAALELIADDADHLDRLIDALLAAARSDGGDVELRPLDLADVAGRSIAEIAAFAEAQHVTIASELPSGITIRADRDLLSRAVLATLHNGVKYTPPGASIHVHVSSDGASARLCIRDEGPGFSNIALVHAFDRFWREDGARGRSGSGLGLAIAQGIVQRCNGEISIDNAHPRGALVTLRFPLPSPEHL